MARQPLSLMEIDLSLKFLTSNRKTIQNEEEKMEKNLEVNIAFKIWNQLNQLESILWDRYRDEFLNLTIEQEDTNISKDDRQDVNDPF